MQDRLVALRVLGRVTDEGAYAERAFAAEATRAALAGRERAFASHLAFGAIKRRRTIDHVVQQLAGRDPGALEPIVRDAVRLGVYQLLYSGSVPAHAAVASSVDLVRVAGRARATGIVNAILRRAADGGAALVEALPDRTAPEAALRRSYPDWIAEVLIDGFDLDVGRALLDAGNLPGELALRVRAEAGERVESELTAAGVRFRHDPDVPSALVLDGPFDVAGSASFAAGDFVPMSRSSQRVATLLAPSPGERVLDACAAPGGKAGHLAELLGGEGLGLVCAERDPGRCRELQEALARQGASGAEVVCGDAADVGIARGPFDAILLDAPCSGLGVVAARADLRWRRSAADVDEMATLQRRLLEALLACLAPAGRLVYAVCTPVPDETTGVTAPFSPTEEVRTWPDRGDGDGFYIARFDS